MTFGERLKQSRIDKGLSQTDLARLAGIHYTQIGRYEKKELNPRQTYCLEWLLL